MIERSWIWRCGAPTSLPENSVFILGKDDEEKVQEFIGQPGPEVFFFVVFFRRFPWGQITNRDCLFLLPAIQFTICWFLVSPIQPLGGLFVSEFLIISCTGSSVRYYALVTTEGHSAGFISHTLLHRFKCHNLTHVHSSASGSMLAHHEHVAK